MSGIFWGHPACEKKMGPAEIAKEYAIPKKVMQLKMCESEVKVAIPKIINGTTVGISVQTS